MLPDEFHGKTERTDDRQPDQHLGVQPRTAAHREHEDDDHVIAQRDGQRDRHADRTLLALGTNAQGYADENKADGRHRKDKPLHQLDLHLGQFLGEEVLARPLLGNRPGGRLKFFRQRTDLAQQSDEPQILRCSQLLYGR